MTELTPAQRALRSRIAAHVSWANTSDRLARTEPGRASFMARFEKQVDPESALPEAERKLRAEAARSAYFAALALKSSIARSRKKRAA